MQTYYDLRDANRRADSFSNQIAKPYANPDEMRREIFKVALEQGFSLEPRK